MPRARYCAIRCGAALAATLLLAALPSSAAEQWRFRTFTPADGLAHTIVRDVLESADGALWFATMGGVTRYEPSTCRWQTFGPGSPGPQAAALAEAMALAEDRAGGLWVATQGAGMARYADGRWTWYTAAGDGLPSDEIAALLVDSRGRLWATPTLGGVAMYDGSSWRAFGPADGLSRGEIGRCAETRAGAILCGTYDRPLLQRFDGKRWSQLAVDAPVDRHFYVHSLLEDRRGHLWLATKGVGVIEGVPAGGGRYSWRVHDSSVGLASNRVGAMLEAKNGVLWFATAAGVSSFDGRRWRAFDRAAGLGSNHVFAITETRHGALWFATLGGGATRYGPSRWDWVTTADGLPSDHLTGGVLRTNRGALWVGTDRGIAVLPPGASRWRTTRTGDVARDYINHLMQDPRGAVWVATRAGLRRFDAAAGWRHYPSGAAGPAHPVVTMTAYAPHDGALWLATFGGVSRLDRRGVWRSFGVDDGLPAHRVNAVLVDRRRRIWAATDNGVASWSGGGSWRAQLSLSPASRTHRIYRLVEGRGGRIWASGLDGVNVLSADGSWRRLEHRYWLPAGVYSRFVMRTRDGSLWFAVRGLGVRRLLRQRWSAFNTAAGLANDTVRDVLQLPDGTLLFATLGGGLSRYRPDRHPPQTFIGSRAGAGDAPASVVHGQAVALSYGGQDVLKDTPTAALLYSHRVDDGPWSSWTSRTVAGLRGLAPGSHLVQVRAMDRDLNVDPTPAVHQLTVVRPWWREPWLLGLATLSLLVLGYALWRIVRAIARERAAVAQQQLLLDQRKRFVRLASHELRKPLTRLAHRAEMLTLPEMRDDEQLLARYAGAMLDDSRHLAQMVETLLDQAKLEEGLALRQRPRDLGAAVEALVADFCAELDQRPRLELPAEPLTAEIDPLYFELALRNLLDNAHKYGGALAQVDVVLREEHGHGLLEVRDRGPGIPADQRTAIFEPFRRGKTSPEHGGFGLGLSFARDIARAHGGDLVLKSEAADETGCVFALTLPLKAHPARTEEGDGAPADHR